MKKVLFIFTVAILFIGLFFAYKFGFNFSSKDFQGKTYEDIKTAAEKDLDKLSIEDLYILAKREDKEEYYRAIYKTYKKENPDLALQYLYNEFVVNNNEKVYELLKEEGKSDISFKAEATGYLGALENYNKFPEDETFTDVPYDFQCLFAPKFYDSKSTDEFIYDFRAKNYELVGNLTPAGEWPYLIGRYIDGSGSYTLDLSTTEGFQQGEDKLFFKNFDGKTVLAFSLTHYPYKEFYQEYYAAIYQYYIYKDYLMIVSLGSDDPDPSKFAKWGIGSISFKDIKDRGAISYYKGYDEISKEDFERNVVPVKNLVSLSKEESKSWTKISTNPYPDYKFSDERLAALNRVRYKVFNNLLLYTYNISLSQDVDIPYLKAYLKQAYTIFKCPNLENWQCAVDEPNKEDFTAYISDLDKDGYPELIMSYMITVPDDENRQHHVKIISYDPEEKATYLLGDFIYANGDNGAGEFQAGGVLKRDGKNYLLILRELGYNQGSEYCLALYEKEGKKLKYVDSTYKVVEYDPEGNKSNEKYPNKKSNYDLVLYKLGEDLDNNYFLNIPLPGENSKEKYDKLYNEFFTDDAKKELQYNSDFPKILYVRGEGIKARALHDPEEIKDILLANKNLEVPSHQRLVIGDKYYPISATLREEGKEFIDIRALKAIENCKIDDNDIIERNKMKYVPLDVLKKENLVEGEDNDFLILKAEENK